MAQETNFGAEKLTSRIVEEAEAEAGRIIVEAEAKAGAISSQAEAEAERLNIEYAKKAEALERQKDADSHYSRVGKTLTKNNPKEYERIIHGKPKTIGNFFDSVLSLFTPDVVRQVPRLQQIEAEIEEERKKQEKQGRNNNHK
mgnify:FL=1